MQVNSNFLSRCVICLLGFLSVLHGDDYKRMAAFLIRDAKKQMRVHDADVQSIIDDSHDAQKKSFFGFDPSSGEEIVTERKQPNAGKTCLASKISNGHEEQAKYQGDSELFVFVSLGMSDEALRAYSQQAKDIGGVLVVRGLVANSFQKTHQRLKSLEVSVDIDPTLFERFDVKRVPSIVLAEVKDGKLTGAHDKVRGHVSLKAALELFASEGDLFSSAQSILKKKDHSS